MNNPATTSRQEWRSNGRRRTEHTLRIYIQLRVEIAVKESNKWYLLSATPAGAPVIDGPVALINYGRYCPAARDEVSRRDGRLPLPRLLESNGHYSLPLTVLLARALMLACSNIS